MSVAKRNSLAIRHLRFTRSHLRQNNVAVLRVNSTQYLMNWRTMKEIGAGELLANGINNMPHHWTLCLALFCRSQTGERYAKMVEVAPPGVCRAKQLVGAMNAQLEKMKSTCNPKHEVLGHGWIATPYDVSLIDDQAETLFDAAGAWDQEEAV